MGGHARWRGQDAIALELMRAITLWICLCAALTCAGWALSALQVLNAGGYAAVLALGLAAGLIWWRRSGTPLFPELRGPRLYRRFRRGFPLAFLVLALMAFIGGVLYAPSNYDALAYRLPRVLHWLAADRWHWIHTVFPRLNQRCYGMEWISAPILSLFHSTRPLFLINWVSFLLLPGLVYGVFTRLGVRPRVAWYWMWLLPTGYCFLLQAGSAGNDLFGAVFVLAAMDFALRAGRAPNSRDFFVAVLAAALMTGAKPSNLPLLLPWTLAMLPIAASALRWPVRTVLFAMVAGLISFLPTAVANFHYVHDWTGLKVETGVAALNPLLLTATNAFLLVLTNLAPPVCPMAGWWHNFFTQHVPAALAAQWEHGMEQGLRTFNVGDLQIEENAGLGFGICVLLAGSLLAVCLARPRMSPPRSTLWLRLVRWSALVPLLVVMAHSWMTAFSREITPYYGLLLPIVLVSAGQGWLVRQRWWRCAAGLVSVLAAVPLVISPARPLFPVLTLCRHLHHPPLRIQSVYTVYRERPDGFAPAKAALPAGTAVLGYVGYDDPETSLWEPFGSRRIEHVTATDTAGELKARGIEYVLIHSSLVDSRLHTSLDAWLQQHDAQIIKTIPLDLRASAGPQDWALVRLN